MPTITEIEGIGEVYAVKFRQAGVKYNRITFAKRRHAKRPSGTCKSHWLQHKDRSLNGSTAQTCIV